MRTCDHCRFLSATRVVIDRRLAGQVRRRARACAHGCSASAFIVQMRMLITGAAGDVGRHVASAATRAGHEVVAHVRRDSPTGDPAAAELVALGARRLSNWERVPLSPRSCGVCTRRGTKSIPRLCVRASSTGTDRGEARPLEGLGAMSGAAVCALLRVFRSRRRATKLASISGAGLAASLVDQAAAPLGRRVHELDDDRRRPFRHPVTGTVIV